MENGMKEQVKAYYGSIAKNAGKGKDNSCGCGTDCYVDATEPSFLYDASFLEGLPEEAMEVSLGCANPMGMAAIKRGDTVLDLGSGGGIDVFIASKYVGEGGKVYGLDMTDEMLALANQNKEKMGVKNVEFIKGYIEAIPLPDCTVDIIISNCVINLCESKEKALQEAYRVLKEGGRLAIADVVVLKDIPEAVKKSAEMWVGCIAGALHIELYQNILKAVGFKDIEITPANIYSREVLEELARSKNLSDVYKGIDPDLLDGAFAGALIKACK
ncbi:arsenite methyltransferase [Alkaliphilus crotonatoxidans]